MFETVGRSLDPWYWMRVIVAIWLVMVGTVLLGWLVLGYMFLKFLAWLVFALLALLFQIDNPIVFAELHEPIEPPEVVVMVDDDMGDFDIVERPMHIDDELPVLDRPEAKPESKLRDRVEKKVANTAILSVLGSSDEGLVLAALMGSAEGSESVFGEGLGSLGGITALGAEGREGYAVGGLRGGRPTEGGISARGGGAEGVVGGVEGGVVGGVTGSRKVVPSSELTFRRQPALPDIVDLRGVRCDVLLSFDTRGVPTTIGVTECGARAATLARRTLRRWRIEPERDGGRTVPVQTHVKIRFPE